jgi:hypothetical protein
VDGKVVIPVESQISELGGGVRSSFGAGTHDGVRLAQQAPTMMAQGVDVGTSALVALHLLWKRFDFEFHDGVA